MATRQQRASTVRLCRALVSGILAGMEIAFTTPAATPNFDLVGFASLPGMGVPGTTGGADGPHVRVSTVADFAACAQTNVPLRIEILNDLDLSSLTNASGGFPTNYPTGEVLVNSNKTIYSRHGAAIRRGTLRIGKGPNGRQNIIIRNLRFRDLWVLDPTGQYDQYGWDYIGIEAGSHHVWVDHCDFEKVYDGMVDIKGGSDFVTVSWCVFRSQKKCSLVGHSDSAGAGAIDRGHLNVTFHHNWYEAVDERIPRMRFGNAHVFNLYCRALGGKGIQSTTEAATLVEHVFFRHPLAGSLPTVEANGGPTGTVKVVNSVIENLPGVTVAFRQYGALNFLFNPPFAAPTPPYAYALDPVAEVPNLVTNFAGVGKIDFELWQMENFNAAQLADPAISGRGADPDADGMSNEAEHLAGTVPTDSRSALRVVSVTRRATNTVITWIAGGGRTNVLQAASHFEDGNFVDLSGPVALPEAGTQTTNFTDFTGSNAPNRFYRVRLAP